ncbi:MAG: iron uptake transporter deferrochelatase/peroxidase subunit [Acidimicrobiia bacterium]
MSRRRFLGAAGILGAATAGALATESLGVAAPAAEASVAGAAVAFHGEHQAGIVTPAQDRLLFASFDVLTDDRDELIALFRDWTKASARMAAGEPVGGENTNPDAPPDDTGEAIGLPPSSLTVTFGFGPTLFTRDGVDRFGIAAMRPAALVELPTFAGDELDPARGGGDLAVQACANDPLVCFHAIRNLARIGRGVVALRWSQEGFGRTSSTDTSQETPRNLMGFKDGTNNVVGEDTAALREHVWVGAGDDPAWMRGGSYLVARRIRMLLEVWDRSTLADQEASIGRVKGSGAPLGGTKEFETVDLEVQDDLQPVIPIDAHIRLSAPSRNGGAKLLRRGYSFTDGIDPVTNQLDAGLFFLAYQRDPRTGFVRVQRNLANDALNEYIKHVGSAVFAVPPGVQAGGFVGETLFT